MTIEKTYTTAQIAELLQVKNYTVREWLRTGQLTGILINGRYRVKESELQNFIDSRQRKN
jgi:excisionase family DNA binding protein